MNLGPYQIQLLDPNTSTANIRKAIMDGRQMRILPASEWQKFSWAEQRILLHETATYVAPTEELVDFLDHVIGDNSAVEICCGNGWIGRELNIPLVDNKAQESKVIKQLYSAIHTPTIHYPKDVIKQDAVTYCNRRRPHTVIACYPAFKWEPDKQIGADYGVNFQQLLRYIHRLVIVGNQHTHHDYSLFNLPHLEYTLSGIITRSEDRGADKVWIWENE